MHNSSFQIDPNPVDGRLTDEAKLKALGDEGVRILLSDSTNSEVTGFTPSEQELEQVLEKLISQAPGRVLLATFASNLSRVQQVINVAMRHGRKVGVTGRSMVNNTRMATELGYLKPPPDGLLTPDQMNYLPPEQVVIDHHNELLVTMSHQIALAIRNAQLYGELRQMDVIDQPRACECIPPSLAYRESCAENRQPYVFDAPKVHNHPVANI